MSIILPGGNNTPVTPTTTPATPVPSLSAASDTGIIGDSITGSQYVNVNLSGLVTGALAWLERGGNTTFDSGVDLPAINGLVTNAALSAGSNVLTFYQQVGSNVSQPGFLSVYLDPVAAAQQSYTNEANLAKAALAYLGRPLTKVEHDTYLPLLQTANGNTSTLTAALANHPEFWTVYRVPDLDSGIQRCYQILYGRDASGLEVYAAKNMVNSGVSVYELPWRIAESALATSADGAVLDARILFSQQATKDYTANLSAAGVSERTLLEVERSTIQTVKALADIGISYESLVSSAKNLGSGSSTTTPPAAPVAAIDPAYDDGTIGDSMTTKSSVKINVTGIMTGGLGWMDTNLNGKFDPGADYPVINGSVTASLNAGPNTFVFYQMLNGLVSTPAYLALLRSDTSTPTTQPDAPKLDLQTLDDDGSASNDNITSKSLVRIDVTGLDATSELAWIDKDGNGIFNLGTDISLQTGATSTTAWVPLTEGINGLSTYQVRGGLKSNAGNLTVIMLKDTDVVTGPGIDFVGNTLSLTFDRPVDWARLDKNSDGFLSVGVPGNTAAELQISWGGVAGGLLNGLSVDLTNYNLALGAPSSGWSVPLPTYGSRFLTVNGINLVVDGDPKTVDKLGILVVGIPDVSNGITSNVAFDITFA